MEVRIKTEISKYLIIATLSAKLNNGKPYEKSYEQQRFGDSKNLAEIKALLLACRHLNQQQELKISINATSPYIKMCIRSLEKWQQSDWVTSKGKEVKHKKEWKAIYELIKSFPVEINCDVAKEEENARRK